MPGRPYVAGAAGMPPLAGPPQLAPLDPLLILSDSPGVDACRGEGVASCLGSGECWDAVGHVR